MIMSSSSFSMEKVLPAAAAAAPGDVFWLSCPAAGRGHSAGHTGSAGEGPRMGLTGSRCADSAPSDCSSQLEK